MTTKAPLVRKAQDVLERAVSTYVQVFAGLLVAANVGVNEIADLSVVKTCAVSALPAFLSVIKSLAAINLPIGDSSASVLNVGYEKIKRVVDQVAVPYEVIKYVERPKETVERKRPVKKVSTTPIKVEKKPAVKKTALKKAK
jgi:hypothetical protein